MIGAIGAAVSGLSASHRAAQTAAEQLSSAFAAAGSPGAGETDLVEGVVGLEVAKLSQQANLAVVRTGDEMVGALLDLFG